MPFTVFNADVPYPLMWDKADWLPMRLEGKDYAIAFERAWRPGNSGNEIRCDRLGRVSYTKVAVRFPYATTRDDAEELRKVSHKAINRLLDVYRCATKESHIGHIPIQELGSSNSSHGVYDVKDDGSVWERNSFRFDMGSGLTLARTQELDGNSILDLAYERPLPVVYLLVLNARRSLLFEEYRVAVIEAETAFEVGVDRILTQYYLSRTTRSTEGCVVPAHSREDVHRILDAGLKNLLNSHVPMALGREFIDTDEHSRWENDLYDLRNAAIHDGKRVREDEAERALEAAEDALVWIGAIVPQQWPSEDRLRQSNANGSWR